MLGSSWRLLGQSRIAFPPPGGAPERLREVIFGSVLGDQAEKVKMIIFKIFNVILDPFSILFIALCCLPCCVAGGAAHMQKS